MSLKLTRASGAQNTFFLANVFESAMATRFQLMSSQEKQKMAKQICLGFEGLSTDGLLFIYPEKNYDFAWDFYNSDGSHADMCGNAARCATLFYAQKIKSQEQIRFLTGAGEIRGTVLGENKVKIEMTPISHSQCLKVLGHQGLFLNTGVPHFVLGEKPDEQIAKKLRKVTDFGSAGANITFVDILGSKKIRAVTFERGVEKFTRACGTGAVAATVYLNQAQGSSNALVLMPGGELLIENGSEGQRPFLTGPAKLEFDIINFEEIFDEK